MHSKRAAEVISLIKKMKNEGPTAIIQIQISNTCGRLLSRHFIQSSAIFCAQSLKASGLFMFDNVYPSFTLFPFFFFNNALSLIFLGQVIFDARKAFASAMPRNRKQAPTGLK